MAMQASAARVSTNLPTSTIRFIGRQREIAALNVMLVDPDIRMITVFAPGGMGKTQFALTVAQQQLERFADGVYVVTLSAPTSAEQLATLVAEILSFQFQPNIPQEQQLLAHIRHRNILFLLDNAEHLAESVPFLSDVLQTARAVKILATSRTKLDLFAETLFPLSGLAYQEEADKDAASNDAVALFLQSAKRVRPEFQLDPHNTRSVLEICRLTQGMPLALVLAASWLALLSPKEIVQEIRRGVDLLETDLRDVPERQRSIRAIFDHTWGFMAADEQRVLMKLSVFHDGFTRDAAFAVAQADLHNLRRLLRIAVLQPSAAEGRYELHELLRQYTQEHLQRSGEYDATLAAHSRYFLDFIAQQEAEIKGKSQLSALDRIQADVENLRAAWEWAAEHNETGLLAGALEGLFWYGMMRSRYQLFEAVYEMTTQRLEHTEDADSQLLRARLRLRYWWMQRWREGSMARYPQVLDELEAMLSHFRRSNATTEIALCLVLLGDAVATLTDDLERAQWALETAYDSFRALDDDFYAAWALHFRAKLLGDTQGIEHGFTLLQQGLALRRRSGDQIGVCYSLYNLSTDLLLLGRLEECEQVTREIIIISRSTGEQSTLLVSQITLSLLALFAGHFEAAREQTEANLRLAGNLNHEFGLVWSRLIHSLLDYFDGTSGATSEGLPSNDSIPTRAFMRYFAHWAYALLQQGDESTIKRHLLSALRTAQGLSARGALIWCLPPLAAWEARYGDPGKATSLLALAQQQPENLMGWLPEWLERTSISTQLETQLGVEAFDSAYERGENWELNVAVSSFLTDGSAPESLTVPAHIQRANQQLIEPLSERELEVLRCITQGLSNREIADELVIELSTVKKHLTHIYGKLEVNTRAQAILRAQQLRLA